VKDVAEIKRLLGASLIEANLITERQLQEALAEQRKSGHSLGYTLINKGYLQQEDLILFLETKLGIPYANLGNYVIDPQVVKLVPKDIAIRYQLIPLLKVKNTLTVAMLDPLDSFVIDSLEHTTGCEIKPLISTEEEISVAIERYYGESSRFTVKDTSILTLQKATGVVQDGGLLGKIEELSRRTMTSGKKAPVIELVDLIIGQAVRDGASDIHIEPDGRNLRIRYRVDGVLLEVMSLSKQLESPVVSRIKVMSNLDIAEKRVPQDGRIKVTHQSREIDLRVSTYPTVEGEKAVLRILDRASYLIELESLGFSGQVLENFSWAIHQPNGIILVTGPTGSGKSTTLYAALDKINTLEKNIVTVEDPVEYRMGIINQSQVNPKAGFDFANGLRSILRQDPDIIMVGEIRDYDTAEIAIRAALTGHLVLSTLHTNDAAGAVTRLIDMGVEPFLVASSVICMMAQRLVRTICDKCNKAYTPTVRESSEIRKSMGDDAITSETKLYKGQGCPICKKTGFRGRTTINEILVPNEEIRELIVSKQATSVIRTAGRRLGMRTLREDGMQKVLDGRTTVPEVVRVAYGED